MNSSSTEVATDSSPSTPPQTERIERLGAAAQRIRRYALEMGEVQGQGYIGQALGVADVLAVAYCDQLRYRPDDPHWEDRDRFLLSIGHYAIALYAALAEAGIDPGGGARDLRRRTTPACRCRAWPPTRRAWRSPAGRSGHGLTVGDRDGAGPAPVGNSARVFNLLSDGELDEGSTWEAAMACAHHGLDNLTAIVDVNALQADGPTAEVLRIEPLARQVAGLRLARPACRRQRPRGPAGRFRRRRTPMPSPPSVIICDTRMGYGVPVPGGAREDALHARRGRRVAGRAHPARRDLRPMTAPDPTSQERRRCLPQPRSV